MTLCLQKTTLIACLCALLATSAMAAHKPTHRTRAVMKAAHPEHPTQVGLASYYGRGFQGRKTAAGEKFDKHEMVAAHPTYPMGTQLRVTNLRNGRKVMVRVNDRGPVKKYRARGVVVDLSEGAASQLGFRRKGKTRVKTEVVEWGKRAAHKSVAASPRRTTVSTAASATVAESD